MDNQTRSLNDQNTQRRDRLRRSVDTRSSESQQTTAGMDKLWEGTYLRIFALNIVDRFPNASDDGLTDPDSLQQISQLCARTADEAVQEITSRREQQQQQQGRSSQAA
jgi:hypothetical protein